MSKTMKQAWRERHHDLRSNSQAAAEAWRRGHDVPMYQTRIEDAERTDEAVRRMMGPDDRLAEREPGSVLLSRREFNPDHPFMPLFSELLGSPAGLLRSMKGWRQ